MIAQQTLKNIIFRVVLPKPNHTLAYSIIKSALRNENDEAYTAYGMRVAQNGTILAEIRDISTNPAAIQKLVNQCNRLHLSIEHFYDVVEDFVTGV
ncbi:MAG: hypothetical protein IJY09_05105 [Lachnospiraceae bacterium]|nr:hypothetical protein [Lachnospiraceae bacterium]